MASCLQAVLVVQAALSAVQEDHAAAHQWVHLAYNTPRHLKCLS